MIIIIEKPVMLDLRVSVCKLRLYHFLLLLTGPTINHLSYDCHICPVHLPKICLFGKLFIALFTMRLVLRIVLSG